jgi:hypothetical protein
MHHVAVMYHRHKVSAQSAAINRPEYEDDELSSDGVDGQEGEASDDEDKTEPKPSTPDDSTVFTLRSLVVPRFAPTRSPTVACLPPTPTRQGTSYRQSRRSSRGAQCDVPALITRHGALNPSQR